MEPADLERSFGREAFGADPGGYHAARPAYPEATWEALRARAGLSAGISLLEIGAGTARARDAAPGGAVGLWWNVFGDPGRADPFHEATRHLFAGQRTSLSAGDGTRPPHALDASARIGELTQAGFDADPPQFVAWTLTLDPGGVRRLYETYSNVAALPAAGRWRLLAGLEEIAAREFGGRVERNMTTAIYTARRGS